MKHEFHAHFAFALADNTTQGVATQWLSRETHTLPPMRRDLELLEDDGARLDVLAQAMVTPLQDRARSGTRKRSGGYRYWTERHAAHWLRRRMDRLEDLGLPPHLPESSSFPPGSWALHLPFALASPYVSKDDRLFHLLENPVRKEWVFQVPMVAASQWKGALRAAMARALVSWWEEAGTAERSPGTFAERRCRLTRLFGDEKGEEALRTTGFASWLDEVGGEEAASAYRERLRDLVRTPPDEWPPRLRGRLLFYPTYFDRLALQVINPHDRKKNVGRSGPVLMECVPDETEGLFLLLHWPSPGTLPPSSGESDDPLATRVREAREDLLEVARGIRALFLDQGIGAKTSSGFGGIHETLPKDGRLVFAGTAEKREHAFGSRSALCDLAEVLDE